ncbi:hypothetical protein WMY93_017644 [Mugilogobius chulae]|uniref:Uncharacterized protein n=1 Tax=Mugilogobius chulae TaxID=88201 RepID=A0AAW0NZ66_9GOBI
MARCNGNESSRPNGSGDAEDYRTGRTYLHDESPILERGAVRNPKAGSMLTIRCPPTRNVPQPLAFSQGNYVSAPTWLDNQESVVRSRDRRLPDLPDRDEPIITRADLEVANSLDTLDLISPSSWCGPIEYSLELPEDPIDWDAVGRSHNDNAEMPLMPPGSDTTGTDAETPLPLMDKSQMFQIGP